MVQSLSIRDSITGEIESIELSRPVSEILIGDLYGAFGRLRLEAPIAEPVYERELISREDCKDYSDDFIYDEQRYRLYFSERTWEQFDLSDAAFMMGYLHIVATRVRYSAMPFMAELILRADLWVSAFSGFVNQLRDDFSIPNYALVESFYDEPSKKAILGFLDALKYKAEEAWRSETVTIIERATRDLKKYI